MWKFNEFRLVLGKNKLVVSKASFSVFGISILTNINYILGMSLFLKFFFNKTGLGHRRIFLFHYIYKQNILLHHKTYLLCFFLYRIICNHKAEIVLAELLSLPQFWFHYRVFSSWNIRAHSCGILLYDLHRIFNYRYLNKD